MSVSITLNFYYMLLGEEKCYHFSVLFLTSVPHICIEIKMNTKQKEQLIKFDKNKPWALC